MKPSRDKLLEQAYEVAGNLLDYKSERTATLALRRRCPEFTADECDEAFGQALELDGAARELVAEHIDLLMDRWDKLSIPWLDRTTSDVPMDDFVVELQSRRPGFPDAVCKTAIAWCMFRHMR